jgi:hypothetical protein
MMPIGSSERGNTFSLTIVSAKKVPSKGSGSSSRR